MTSALGMTVLSAGGSIQPGHGDLILAGIAPSNKETEMTSQTPTAIRTLTRRDQDRAISTVVAAFTSDPINRSVFPDVHQYLTYLPPFAAAFAGGSFDAGMALATDGGEGVALWMPPGVHSDEETMGTIVEASLSKAPHFEEVVGFVEKQSNLHPKFEHMYLPFLAVDPVKQGNGAGSKLLAHALEICDERGLPAYLESTSLRSRALYERHGFEVVGEIQFGSSPAMWPMLRHPR